MQGTTKIAVGAFDDRADADAALAALMAAGFQADNVDVAALQVPEPQSVDHSTSDQPGVRVDGTTGILAGGILGGVAGWLIAASAITVPGLGALIAAGALVGALGGAGIGAATGGLIGYLLDQGLTQTEATYYDERVRHGAALVVVRDTNRAAEAQAILLRLGAHDLQTRPSP